MKDKQVQNISDYVNDKNSNISGAKYYDDRVDRFTEALEGVGFYDDGTYDIKDLDEAWDNTTSTNVYDGRGIQSI
jgi:hypothetical protein